VLLRGTGSVSPKREHSRWCPCSCSHALDRSSRTDVCRRVVEVCPDATKLRLWRTAAQHVSWLPRWMLCSETAVLSAEHERNQFRHSMRTFSLNSVTGKMAFICAVPSVMYITLCSAGMHSLTFLYLCLEERPIGLGGKIIEWRSG